MSYRNYLKTNPQAATPQNNKKDQDMAEEKVADEASLEEAGEDVVLDDDLEVEIDLEGDDEIGVEGAASDDTAGVDGVTADTGDSYSAGVSTNVGTTTTSGDAGVEPDQTDMSDFIQILASKLKFPTDAKRDDFTAEMVGIFVEDLVAGLYDISEFADMLELFEEEIAGYNHHDDILGATARLLGRIPEQKRFKIIANSYQKTGDRLLKKMVENKELTEAQVAEIRAEEKEITKNKQLAQQAKQSSQSGEDARSALESLAK